LCVWKREHAREKERNIRVLFHSSLLSLSSSLSLSTGAKFCTEEESHALLDRYVELGGNFIDTANVYAAGKYVRCDLSLDPKQ
jgi:aryl-alcohol dehydrogenase-like predicted oxidoreductase